MSEPSADAVPPDLADEARLLRARVLESLAGSAWHELAQPLNGLRSFATLLRSEGLTADQLGVDPALVEEASTAAERLSRALTDLARGSDRVAPVHALVADVLVLAGNMTIDVETHQAIPTDLPQPAVPTAVTRDAVAGLVLDALEAMGGPRRAKGRLAIEAASSASAVELVIEDDGDTRRPATLAVAARLLAAHGGSVRHERTGEQGNRVRVSLPLPAPAAARADTDTSSEPTAQPPPITVLVCDDDPVIRDLVVRALARAGVAALSAGSGHDALAELDRQPVDVVLTDDRMRGMSGRALYEAAVGRHPALRGRFVLMSGDVGDQELAAFAEEEGLRLLAKPFDLRSLAPTLREVAGR